MNSDLYTAVIGSAIGLIVLVFVVVLAVTWLILPFILMGRLTRIQRSLDIANDLAHRRECRELNAAQAQESQPEAEMAQV